MVQHDRNNNKHEDPADALNTLLQNIAADKDALMAKGPNPDGNIQIQELYDDLVADSTAHRLLTFSNMKLLRALFAPMKHLLDNGKSLHKTVDKVKLRGYTLRKILEQVRRAQGNDNSQKAA